MTTTERNEHQPSLDLIYEKDREQELYEDQLKWNRIKTAIVIEGGLLVAYIQKEDLGLEYWLLLIIIVCAAMLVLCTSILAVIDRHFSHTFRKRARSYERGSVMTPDLKMKGLLKHFSGFRLLVAMAVVVNAFNILLLIVVIVEAFQQEPLLIMPE